MILALLRRVLRGPVRRLQLARGVRPALVVIRLRRRGPAADLRVAGLVAWWASDEDVRAELARAWAAARRTFRRRHPGVDVRLTAPVVLTHEWEWRGL